MHDTVLTVAPAPERTDWLLRRGEGAFVLRDNRGCCRFLQLGERLTFEKNCLYAQSPPSAWWKKRRFASKRLLADKLSDKEINALQPVLDEWQSVNSLPDTPPLPAVWRQYAFSGVCVSSILCASLAVLFWLAASAQKAEPFTETAARPVAEKSWQDSLQPNLDMLREAASSPYRTVLEQSAPAASVPEGEGWRFWLF